MHVCTVPRARYQGSALDPPCRGLFPAGGFPLRGAFPLRVVLFVCVPCWHLRRALNMYPALYFRIESYACLLSRGAVDGRVDGRAIVCEHTNSPRGVYDLRKKTMKTLLGGFAL